MRPRWTGLKWSAAVVCAEPSCTTCVAAPARLPALRKSDASSMDKGEGSLCPFFLYYQGNRLLSRGVCGIDVRVSTVKALYGKGCNLGILLSTGAGRYKELKRAAIRS